MNTVVVASVIATKWHNGGNAAAVLNWVNGFRKLGLRTFFVEQIGSEQCVDEHGSRTPFEQSVNASYFASVMRSAGLQDASALVCNEGHETIGLANLDLLDVAESADFLLNITGHLTLPPVMRRIRRKVYLDLDPGYTQFWHASGQNAKLAGHDAYFTIGENIGTPACSIPTGDIVWRHTRQPIALTSQDGGSDGTWTGHFTTVASWRGSYGPVQYGSTTFGLKVHEFRKFLDLPERTGAAFEVALDIDAADAKDLRALETHGWTVVDPRHLVPDPWSFDSYIKRSDAEWSVAQGIYVSTNSGWFSDRTARYLAAGKPAVVQDTGFGRSLPVGEGLLSFRTMDEALDGIRAIERDPRGHREAARSLAETYFGSDRIVSDLLNTVELNS
jgi:hypothetical protein